MERRRTALCIITPPKGDFNLSFLYACPDGDQAFLEETGQRTTGCRWVREELGFPGGSDGKESACSAGDLGSFSGLGRSPAAGLGNPLQYFCLENPHGQRSLVGFGPWSCRVGMAERLSTSTERRWPSDPAVVCHLPTPCPFSC